MADSKVAFELVAPERLLASIDCDMVVIPGADGDFGYRSVTARNRSAACV